MTRFISCYTVTNARYTTSGTDTIRITIMSSVNKQYQLLYWISILWSLISYQYYTLYSVIDTFISTLYLIISEVIFFYTQNGFFFLQIGHVQKFVKPKIFFTSK